MAAGDVALKSDGKGGQRLVLQNVDSNVCWMNNAPARSADFEPLGNFVNLWLERFGDVLPNASFHDDEIYDVDKLAPLASTFHPEGLLPALPVCFK